MPAPHTAAAAAAASSSALAPLPSSRPGPPSPSPSSAAGLPSNAAAAAAGPLPSSLPSHSSHRLPGFAASLSPDWRFHAALQSAAGAQPSRPFQPRQAPFSAASLPRTSSLLPPARITAAASAPLAASLQPLPPPPGSLPPPPTAASAASAASAPGPYDSPVHAQAPPVSSSAAPASAFSSPPRRPSRSSSTDTPSHDRAARQLDRWSVSTGSSHNSAAGAHHILVHRHQRSASFSRRLSASSFGPADAAPAPAPAPALAPDASTPPTTHASSSAAAAHQQHTPRKLQKTRPGTSSGGSPLRASPAQRLPRARSPVASSSASPVQPPPSPTRIPPLASLPPIVALPSLEQEIRGGAAAFSGRPVPQQRRPQRRRLSSEDNTQSFYFGDAPPPGAVSSAAASAAASSASSPLATRSASAQADRQALSPADSQPLSAGSNAFSTSNPTTTTTTATTATMPYGRDPEAAQPSGGRYPRSRSQAANGSTDSTRSRERGPKPPSQKAMLSRALQKANTAVQLDNAGNIEGAREAYAEACDLLHQVLLKTPGDDDKRKLEAIRVTYSDRIQELDQLASTQRQDPRPLPRRPSTNSLRGERRADLSSEDGSEVSASEDSADDDVAEVATAQAAARVTRLYNNNGSSATLVTNLANNTHTHAHAQAQAYDDERRGVAEPRSIPSFSVPLTSSSPRLLQSSFSTTASEQPRQGPSLLTDQYTLQSSFSRSPRREFFPPHKPSALSTGATLQLPSTAAAAADMPPPLSPRRLGPLPNPPSEPPPPPAATTYAYAGNAGHGLGIGAATSPPQHGGLGHSRAGSHEMDSWLDPINESGSSTASSVHSRSSSMGIRRKHIRAASGATEAEFDAALDDAIEAAYDDGYEPMNPDPIYHVPHDYGSPQASSVRDTSLRESEAQITNSLRKVELAKERVRESEREAKEFERQLRLRGQQQQQQQQQLGEDGRGDRGIPRDFLDAGDDSEEEERILEEMTNGYAIEDFAFGLQSKAQPLPPRESDSSEFTSRTWHSSLASNPPTATTVLSTVTESTTSTATAAPLPGVAKGPTAAMPPPPTQALPQLPPQPQQPPPPQLPPPSQLPPPPPQARPSTSSGQNPARAGSAQSVRNRRLSGQNMKQLKIETTKLNPPPPGPGGGATTAGYAAAHPPPATTTALSASATIIPQSRMAGFLVQQRQALSAGPSRPGSSAAGSVPAPPFARQAPPPPSPSAGTTPFFSGASSADASMPPPNFPPPTPPIPQDSDSMVGRAGSPSTGRSALRKNFSSSSLRSMRSRNMSVTNLDGGGSDMSPGTPLSNQFMLSTRQPDVPTLPAASAATAASYKDRIIIATSGVGGMHLLESGFHSPTTPGSPNPLFSDAPVALEPCPTDTMLRPFWLMRCLYQTLVHPRGGYLSNKLFVPSDVWRVRGVRLKNVDEKVANCDYLTAALLKLAQVDTCDADAVLEEMQSLEGVLEQVQAVLTRKLGSEVGVQSTNALFKEASIGLEPDGSGGGGGGGGLLGSSGAGIGGIGAGGSGGSGGAGAGGSGAVPRTGSVSGNARSFSWRRLRSKNSSAGLNSSYGSASSGGGGGSGSGSAGGGRKESVSEAGGGGGGGKDGGGPLPSLPMTAQPTRRPAKRDVASAKFEGPNAMYMASLARLFDAAQSIDQIARQVDDPGLRHADKTQVGLELCTRHAAEFFAFYICRFVLSDVSLLLEKFIKRGSEWVLA